MTPSELREKWIGYDKEIVESFNQEFAFSAPPIEARLYLAAERLALVSAALSQLLQHLAEKEAAR